VFLTGEGALNPDIIDFSALSIMSSASELPRNTPSTVLTILGRDTNMLLLESILEEFKVVNLVGGPGVGETTFLKYL